MARKPLRPKHIVAKGTKTFDLTKIDVAEALIKSAVRQFFEEAHPVPIYALANAAREILTSIGDKTGVETLLHALARQRALTIADLTKESRKLAAFFKHADRDAHEKIQFSEWRTQFLRSPAKTSCGSPAKCHSRPKSTNNGSTVLLTHESLTLHSGVND
jgi:hypothetical protein